MLLVVDVGNSNTVIGLYRDPTDDDLSDHWRAATDSRRTSDEWLLLFQQFLAMANVEFAMVHSVVIASVVPRVTVALRSMAERLGIDALFVSSAIDSGVELALDNPEEAGADRIANAAAVYAIEGGPSIVVDLGTATTFDVVSASGALLGCIILPGIETSLDALFDKAAALRRIEIKPPDKLIGTTTVGAVQSGATHGYAAQVDGLCERIEKELGPCHIVSTGGLSGVITPLSERIQRHDPWLTLRGLRLIYLRQTTNSSVAESQTRSAPNA